MNILKKESLKLYSLPPVFNKLIFSNPQFKYLKRLDLSGHSFLRVFLFVLNVSRELGKI